MIIYVYIYTYCVYIHIYIYMHMHGLLQILLCHFFRAILFIYTPILCLQCIINFVDCRQIYLQIRIPIPYFHCWYLLLLCQRWRLQWLRSSISPAAQVPNDAFAPPVMGLPSSPHEKPGPPGPPGPPGMAPPGPPKAPGPPPSAGLSVAKRGSCLGPKFVI